MSTKYSVQPVQSQVTSPCGCRGVEDKSGVALNDVAQVGREQLRQDREGFDVLARVADGGGLEMFNFVQIFPPVEAQCPTSPPPSSWARSNAASLPEQQTSVWSFEGSATLFYQIHS